MVALVERGGDVGMAADAGHAVAELLGVEFADGDVVATADVAGQVGGTFDGGPHFRRQPLRRGVGVRRIFERPFGATIGADLDSDGAAVWRGVVTDGVLGQTLDRGRDVDDVDAK